MLESTQPLVYLRQKRSHAICARSEIRISIGFEQYFITLHAPFCNFVAQKLSCRHIRVAHRMRDARDDDDGVSGVACPTAYREYRLEHRHFTMNR